MMELLYDFKADLNRAGGTWPAPLGAALYSALNGDQSGHEMVTWLLRHGSHVNIPPRVIDTPLNEAVTSNSVVMVNELLAAGADPDLAGHAGRTPVLNSVFSNGPLVDLLLSHGANPNIYDDRGWSPLLEAVPRNDTRKVKLLLAHGADVNHGDRDGWTAYDQALLQGCPEIVAALEKAGATQH